MIDYIIMAIIALIIVGAVWYVVKAKKNGKKCIGCPEGCCSSKKMALPVAAEIIITNNRFLV